MTRGKYAYDFCDTGMVCPLSKMYTLGSGFIPSANHAGGLRYHGMSSVVSELYDEGLIEARSVDKLLYLMQQLCLLELKELFLHRKAVML